MTEPELRPVALGERRDATIARLCELFAADHMEANDLERLIDRAHEATSLAELDVLLEGLPTPATQSVAVPLPESAVEPSQLVVAIMGGAERKGAWTPARVTRVLAVMGGAVLDFRDVRLPGGTTEIQILALMGGVEVVVPPGLRVASDGIGIMGGFEHSTAGGAQPVSQEGPLLRIRGMALMGGVEITERLPGESPGDARRRRRREAKSRRHQGRRLKSGDD